MVRYIFSFAELESEEYEKLVKRINDIIPIPVSDNYQTKLASFIIAESCPIESLGIPAPCHLRRATPEDPY